MLEIEQSAKSDRLVPEEGRPTALPPPRPWLRAVINPYDFNI